MMKLTTPIFLASLLLLGACTRSEPQPSVDVTADAVDGTLQQDTDRYSINLNIPLTANVDAQSDIAAFLQQQVDELLQSALEEPEPGYFTTHQYELRSDWESVQSDHLYTFIVRGHAYTGGAHGMPFVRTFTYSTVDDERVDLEQVLAGDDSLAALSAMATGHFDTTLASELDASGLAPEWANWHNWFVSNNRISFVFAPYQIAAYSEGEQMFSVIVEPSTRHLFNPDYFDVYDAEISVTDEHGHGPDPGSEEAARSVAWQLISRSPAYVEDGHSLEITNVERLPDDGWLIAYTWQHYGDPEGDYAGQVRVVNDRPEFVD